MEEPNKMSDWLTAGMSYLLPKPGDNKEVRNCQTTIFKTQTGTTARRICTHLKSRTYYQQSKKVVTLAAKCARIN
jgi:hypothetical protein